MVVIHSGATSTRANADRFELRAGTAVANSGVMAEFLFNGNEHVIISGNRIQFNNGYGVETYAVKDGRIENNVYEGNGNNVSQQKISADKLILQGK